MSGPVVSHQTRASGADGAGAVDTRCWSSWIRANNPEFVGAACDRLIMLTECAVANWSWNHPKWIHKASLLLFVCLECVFFHSCMLIILSSVFPS